MKPTETDSREIAGLIARAACAKKAEDLVILDVRDLIGITDYFVICSGANQRQVGTIVEEVTRRLKQEAGKPYRREGERELRWVLLDYIDVVVHVFLDEERRFYDLERLWKDAPRLEVDVEQEPASGAGG